MPPTPLRRVPPPPAAPEGVNFGSLDLYAGGFQLPEGDYALEFMAQLFQPTNSQTGAPMGAARLGVMLAAHPLAGGAPFEQFLSMGSKAHESFMPEPDTGKSLVQVPGGPASTMNNKTNWFLFLKSLYDSGLPEGIFTNDLSVLDGIHVHTQLVPEPEDRKGFAAKTGEAAAEERKGPQMTVVVTEIKEDGKPWEGTGGMPDATTPKPAAKVAPKAAVKPAAKAPAKPAPKPAPTVVEAAGDEDVMTAAINGVTAVLEVPANANGCTKLLLRTGTFKAVNTASGAEMAQSVIDTFFGSDEALNSLVGQLGYVSANGQVKPQ